METQDEKRREVKPGEGYVDPLGDDITKKIGAGEVSELVVAAEGEERTTWFVWLLVFCSSISGLLFGQSYLFCSHPPSLIR
jgi:SP family myo-inositol transporter-like MFS transporter 13